MSEEQVALVTGGANGIGEATARRFAAAGFTLVIADVNRERGTMICSELKAIGAQCEFHSADVSDESAVLALSEAIYSKFNRLDVVVNSAGILQNAVFLSEMAMSEYDRLMAVNLRGTVLVGRLMGARMCKAGTGSIIHLCSLTSFYPSGQVAYAVSKAGLKMLTEVMAAEFGPQGVRVNAVAPGYTLTPAMKQRIDRGERDPAVVIEKSALRRFVEPSEVADAIFFLCSDQARAITGVTLPIDCGWLVHAAYRAYAAQP